MHTDNHYGNIGKHVNQSLLILNINHRFQGTVFLQEISGYDSILGKRRNDEDYKPSISMYEDLDDIPWLDSVLGTPVNKKQERHDGSVISLNRMNSLGNGPDKLHDLTKRPGIQDELLCSQHQAP